MAAVSPLNTMAVAMVALMVLVAGPQVQGQGQIPDCASKLGSCAMYLNTTTKPPESCCQPIREALRTQKVCLCNLYNNPSLFQALQINLTQALSLPPRCGISNDVSSCKPSSPGATSPTASLSPPGVPGGGDKNGSSKMAWMGVSTILFFWASIMAY
ncbi:hypothetical protein Sjap_020489 [Stephania japonica]|uniref:Bifunctional inhibitor/plant lipid transfer protein/seed storage helical domain-containing protein n=1 Tax=Stephania japonica TaxID=461633 RepID=A0AAP0F3G9_9MAGN